MRHMGEMRVWRYQYICVCISWRTKTKKLKLGAHNDHDGASWFGDESEQSKVNVTGQESTWECGLAFSTCLSICSSLRTEITRSHRCSSLLRCTIRLRSIRPRFDGRSTVARLLVKARSLSSQWHNPLAAVTLTLLCPRPHSGGIKRWHASDVGLTSIAYSRAYVENRGLERLKLAQR